MTKAFTAACSNAWAITPDALQMILKIAARENDSLQAIESKLGRKLENTDATTVLNGVARIPVTGPIFPKANLMTQMSGATSVESLAKDFTSALENPRVKAVIFDVDSPGGAVSGISEFSDMIYGARGEKPIVAYVSHLGASAAYWIASACDEIVANDTAILGSIGVLTAVPKNDAESSEDVVFVASQSPNKRSDPETEKGKAQIQTMVDDLASVFVNTVARNRGVTTDTVLSDFGAGGVMVGQKAVQSGLADRLGSYDALLAELTTGDMSIMAPRKTAAKAEEPNEELKAEETSLPDAAAEGNETLAKLAAEMKNFGPYAVEDGSLAGPACNPGPVGTAGVPGTSDTISTDTSAVDDLTVRLAEMEKKLAAQEAYAASLEREKALGTLAKVAADGGWYGDANDHASFMYDLSDEQRAFYQRHMSATAEQLKQSALFTPIGSSNPSDVSGDVGQQVDGLIKAIMAADPLKTYETAMHEVFNADAGLAHAYLSKSN